MDEQIKKIYQIRKSGDLISAYNLAKKYCDYSNDDIKGALAWTLIDLCKYCIKNNDYNNAQEYYSELSNIQFDDLNDFTIKINGHIKKLMGEVDPIYKEIEYAEELRKSDQYEQSYNILHQLYIKELLSQSYHETYGWSIYNYISRCSKILSISQKKHLMLDYLQLKNPRPSLLHSIFLSYADTYQGELNLDLYKYFVLWGPQYIREEDVNSYINSRNGEVESPLVCKVFKSIEFTYGDKIDIVQLLSDLPSQINRSFCLDLIREPFYQQLCYIKDKSILWNKFDEYNRKYSSLGDSLWHSKILRLANRYMVDENGYRFVKFLRDWGVSSFRQEDWNSTEGEMGKQQDPLVISVLKHCYDVIKSYENKKVEDLEWIIPLFQEATVRFPEDDWLLRKLAMLYIWNDDVDAAILLYKKLVIELGDKYYIWEEYSECVNGTDELKIGMLCMALLLERNEDYIGDIHLRLAQLLVNTKHLDKAYVELVKYKQHRDVKGWKVSALYHDLMKHIGNTTGDIAKQKSFYKEASVVAEEYVYQDYEWHDFVLLNIWEDKGGGNRCSLMDERGFNFQINLHKFVCLRKAKRGDVLMIKGYDKNEVKGGGNICKYVPLLMKVSNKTMWDILSIRYGYLEYINHDKNRMHIVLGDSSVIYASYKNNQYKVGQYLKCCCYDKKYKDKVSCEVLDLQQCNEEDVISRFKNALMVVNHIDEEKQCCYLYTHDISVQKRLDEFEEIPHIGDFYMVYYYNSERKNGIKYIKPIKVIPSIEINSDLKKIVNGRLVLKYKNMLMRLQDGASPDFAFVEDCFVSKKILESNNVTEDCDVQAYAVLNKVRNEEKWIVYKIVI